MTFLEISLDKSDQLLGIFFSLMEEDKKGNYTIDYDTIIILYYTIKLWRKLQMGQFVSQGLNEFNWLFGALVNSNQLLRGNKNDKILIGISSLFALERKAAT